ncbi:DUF732 domain-containing protein [uncultured Kocuria sp.]|uniref:DUF732 domain-containing protein n=1 Tax=uncultured Kocuria sp. TaxID=259305 RepID=UPI00260B1E40|nr:DUF732 domain-containing protein [uncultured Kocuria sp.]
MRAILAAVAAVLVLSGCAAEQEQPATEASPTPTATTASLKSSTTKPAPKTTKAEPALSRDEQIEQVFLGSVRDEYPELQFSEDGDLVSVGEGLCQLYDGGAKTSDVNDFILTAAGVEYTLNELVAMHGAAVGAFCPEHIDKLG